MLVTLAASAPAGPLATMALSSAPSDVDGGLDLAARIGALKPAPGRGSTRDLWEALATIAAVDLGAVRAVEPHLDAVAILVQAGVPVPPGPAGVFAAEGGEPLAAAETAEGWMLDGTKPWCSLADRLDWALITATLDGGQRQLFLVDLHHPGVVVEPGRWVARGLTEVPSGPVQFTAVPAEPIGAPGWYLERPGFAWGGIGVAACWYGGAVGIGRTIHDAARTKPNPYLLMHLGAIDELLQSSRRALAEAATRIDAGDSDPLLVKRVRATVARACEEIIDRAGHALGPAPLALDAAHAKRVADLALYVRQHHAERDQASLGTAVAAGPLPW